MTDHPTPLQVAGAELLLAQRAKDPLHRKLLELAPEHQWVGLARRLKPIHEQIARELDTDPEIVAFLRGALCGALAERAHRTTTVPENFTQGDADDR